MTARWTSADLHRQATPQKTLVVNPRTTEQATTPAKGSEAKEGGKNRGKTTPTVLRPRYQVATNPGFDGGRMVFVGLSNEMQQRLAAYAKTLGIQEQN